MEPDGPTPTTITHAGGAKFSIRIRSHEIMVDQTIAGGGCDSAPSPLELLGASLGSCVAYYVHHFFHTRGLPADGLIVEVTEKKARNPYRIESFTVKLTLPADMPEKYMPLLHRVIETCPAHNTLVAGTKIEVDIVTPITAESAV